MNRLSRFLVVGALTLLTACGAPGGGPTPGPGPRPGPGPQPPPGFDEVNPLHDTIAYVRADSSDEIRLINPDGSGDRTLWAHGQADPHEVYEVWSLAWHPDAKALAFASTHESWCSLFHADIYAVGADGAGYRRVTQAPACAELADYPKGTVRIPVENSSFLDSFSGFLYFQGAPSVQPVNLPPGGSTVVTFENVADFGDGEEWLQAATVIAANDAFLLPDARYIHASTIVDVQDGGTVTTAETQIFVPDTPWEAFAPTWHPDGRGLAFVMNANSLLELPVSPQPLTYGTPLLAEDAAVPDIIDHLAWGPTPETANRLLHKGTPIGGPQGIYLTTAGGAASEPLLSFENFENVRGLAWLPDGSGFVYSADEMSELYERIGANLFIYDFASRQRARITSFTGEFAGMLSVSPDGQQVVFERAATLNELETELVNPDLWVANRDGSGLRLLVENARAPAWSP